MTAESDLLPHYLVDALDTNQRLSRQEFLDLIGRRLQGNVSPPGSMFVFRLQVMPVVTA